MDSLFTFFLFVMVPTMIVVFLLAPMINRLFVPGFSGSAGRVAHRSTNFALLTAISQIIEFVWFRHSQAKGRL